MTEFKFTLIFIIFITLIAIALDYYIGLEKLSKYLIVMILVGFYFGQYSTRFSKKRK